MPTNQQAVSYVALASNAYSGSTLLSYLLGAHPEIATVSDVSGTRRKGRMADFRCSCGELMAACPFWSDVERAAKARGIHDLDLGDFQVGFDEAGPSWLAGVQARSLHWSWLEDVRDAALRPFGVRREMEAMGQRIWQLAQAILEVDGGHVFVDASKERMRIRYLDRFLPGELRVIHLVRDVRGVVDSTLRRDKNDLTAAGAARRWKRTNAAILRQLEAIPPERQIRVRYEDLCADVDATLASLYAFCGVDPTIQVDLQSRTFHVLGNSMRLRAHDEIRLDERWRELPPLVQREVVATAAPVVAQLYPEMSDVRIDRQPA
jgi:hypothetical protein